MDSKINTYSNSKIGFDILLYLYLYINIYIYICVCVCVCTYLAEWNAIFYQDSPIWCYLL